MNIFLLIISFIIWIIGINFLIKHRFIQRDVRAIRATETSKIADLRSMQESIAQEMGHTDAWREQVEVKGRVTCNNPLTAKLSEYSCVYCHTLIEEEYEKTEYDTDEDGNTDIKEHRGRKTISKNQIQKNFYLADETDKIFIDLTGAEIDALTVVNEFEPHDRSINENYRILGYQHTEKIIELESEVYIIGEMKSIDGRLQIGSSSDRTKPFIVSYQSEEKLLDSKINKGKNQLRWGSLLFVLGSAIIVYSLFKVL